MTDLETRLRQTARKLEQAHRGQVNYHRKVWRDGPQLPLVGGGWLSETAGLLAEAADELEAR